MDELCIILTWEDKSLAIRQTLKPSLISSIPQIWVYSFIKTSHNGPVALKKNKISEGCFKNQSTFRWINRAHTELTGKNTESYFCDHHCCYYHDLKKSL